MKKLFLFLLLGIGLRAGAQSIAACNNVQNICTNPSFLFQGISGTGLPSNLSVSNPTTNPQTGNGANPTGPNNNGCLLTSGPGPQWLLLTVSVSGNLGFIFGEPSSPNPQVGLYDWAMWLYTANTCSNVFNNTQPPVACNWNASASGGTGMGTPPTGGVAGNYQPSIPVTAGQQYLILISNYSGVTTPVSFTSTGTASLTCGFNSAICAGNSTTVSPVGFVPISNPTYTLVPGGITNGTGNFTVTPLTSTTYTVIGTGTTAQGNLTTQSSTVHVTVNPQPTVAPTFTQTTCTNSVSAVNLHLGFIPVAPTPSYSINWSATPAGYSSVVPVTAYTVMNGMYNATVTAAGGCTALATFSIDPPPAPANFTVLPVLPVYSITCASPSLILDASNTSFSYTWTNGVSAPQTDPEIMLSAQNTLGNWTVTAVNPVTGCSSTHTFVVGINTLAPTAYITPTLQTITCVSTASTVSVSAQPTFNVTQYIVGPGGGLFTATSHTVIYSPGGPGCYKDSIVNDVNGCYIIKPFCVLSNDNFPVLNISSTTNYTIGCGTHSITQITLTGTTTPSGGAVSFSLGNSSFSGNGVYTLNIPGSYTAAVKDNVSNCITSIPLAVILNNQPPDIHIQTPLTVLDCNNPATILTAVTANPHVDFTWTMPSSTGTVALLNYSLMVHTNTNTNTPVAGTYTLSLYDRDNGCTSTTTTTILQNLYPPKAAMSVSSNSVTCKTQTVQLTNSSTTGIPASAGFPVNQIVQAQLWQGPPPQTPAQLVTNYTGAVSGPYSLTVQDLNNGCVSQATVYIYDNRSYPTPVFPNGSLDTIDCGAPFKVITAAFTPTNNLAYYWITPDNNTQTGQNRSLQTLTIVAPGPYRPIATNTITGCVAASAVTVVAGSLNGEFSASHTSGYAPLNVTFINNSNSVNTSSIISLWSFGNGTQTTTPSASITTSALYTQPGTYTVVMYARKGGCQDSAMKIITVDVPSKLNVPNVFTPNGDGVNDIFFLKTANLTEITALIYDRWGHKVYELNSSTGNIAWDGKTETGKDASAGTYFYIIKANGKDGQTYDTKGTITLYR